MNTLLHSIDACTYSAGKRRTRKTYGWVWTACLFALAIVAVLR